MSRRVPPAKRSAARKRNKPAPTRHQRRARRKGSPALAAAPAATARALPQARSDTATAFAWRPPVPLILGLLGAAAGAAVAATTTHFSARWAAGADAALWLVGVALLSLAAGVRVPQRFAAACCVGAWRHFVERGRRADGAALVPDPASVDRPLVYLVLAVAALVAGTVTALLPISWHWLAGVERWLGAHFVWSWPVEAVQRLLLVAGVVVPAMAALGVAASCAYQAGTMAERRRAGTSTWLLAGAGLAFVGLGWVTDMTARPTAWALSAALPVFLVGALAGLSGSAARAEGAAEAAEREAALAHWSDRNPRLLRTAIVCVGVAAGWMVVAASAGGASETARADRLMNHGSLAWSLLVLAGGTWCGSAVAQRWGYAMSTFGACCALAGGTAMVTIAGPGAEAGWSAPLASAFGLGAVGVAYGCGRATLQERVAVRSGAGVTLLARVLAWLGASLVVLGSWSAGGGAGKVVAMAAVVLVGLGMAIVVRDPLPATRAGVRLRWAMGGAAVVTLGCVLAGLG